MVKTFPNCLGSASIFYNFLGKTQLFSFYFPILKDNRRIIRGVFYGFDGYLGAFFAIFAL